jgi:hypothetical protein
MPSIFSQKNIQFIGTGEQSIAYIAKKILDQTI